MRTSRSLDSVVHVHYDSGVLSLYGTMFGLYPFFDLKY